MPFRDRLGDRRGELRFEIIGHLWGSLESVEQLPLHDVGRGGALVESRRPLAQDSVHAMALRFGAEPLHDVRVRVRHVRPSPVGRGLPGGSRVPGSGPGGRRADRSLRGGRDVALHAVRGGMTHG